MEKPGIKKCYRNEKTICFFFTINFIVLGGFTMNTMQFYEQKAKVYIMDWNYTRNRISFK